MKNLPIAILFARSDSVYKNLIDLDIYDEQRDARTFNGIQPVIAHPPCRAWARLRGMSKPAPHEKQLAKTAVDLVRSNGGILEHPESSTLWLEKQLPNPITHPAQIDKFGGFTLPIQQFTFGHKARKNTWLYICGIRPIDLPAMPFRLGEAGCVVARGKRTKKWKKELTLAEREHTPIELAMYLVEIARLIQVQKNQLLTGFSC